MIMDWKVKENHNNWDNINKVKENNNNWEKYNINKFKYKNNKLIF